LRLISPADARLGFRALAVEEQPLWLERTLLREAMTGLDPARRVAMGLVP
jgi:hypothetical protein